MTQMHMAEFKVAMTSTSTHNEPVFYYKAKLAIEIDIIIILTKVTTTGPHH